MRHGPLNRAAAPFSEIDRVQENLIREMEQANRAGAALFPGLETDTAQYFAEAFQGLLVYDHGRGKWYEWDDLLWRVQDTGRTSNRIAAICHAHPEQKAHQARFIRGVESLVKNIQVIAVGPGRWNADPMLLGTPAGTLDLTTGRLSLPNAGDFISKACNTIPANKADCPRWLHFLKQATNDDAELTRFLQQWAGYGLTGCTSEQKLAFIWGDGGNGKGVFINSLAGIMGDLATKAAMDTFIASHHSRHPTELAYLQSARMVHAAETDEGRAWDEARIKELTGGDIISARFMRKDFFQFRPSFTLTIIGNFRPILRNVGPSVRRRFLIIPFVNKPEMINLDLEAELKAEWPGILRWMIDGALDWQQHGLVIPAIVTRATEAYFNAQDLLGEWLDEECRVDPGNSYRKGKPTKLFASWSSFAKARNEEPGKLKAFGDSLETRGFPRCRSNADGRYHEGIELKHNGHDHDA